MCKIRTFAILAVMLTGALAVTPASACPVGYAKCGMACCPGR
ncbi:hypothetical protein [Bradyrhizobium sp. STM 3562]